MNKPWRETLLSFQRTRSRSLYSMSSPVRLSSVAFVHPTQKIEID